MAGALQPSVIFIDEIDSLLAARKADGVLAAALSGSDASGPMRRRPMML